MGEFTIGQIVFLGWFGRGRELTPATVSKIGRRWISVTREFPFGDTETSRFDRVTMEAHDEDRFQRAWLSTGDYETFIEQERAETQRRDLWREVREKFSFRPPDQVTAEMMDQWINEPKP